MDHIEVERLIQEAAEDLNKNHVTALVSRLKHLIRLGILTESAFTMPESLPTELKEKTKPTLKLVKS